MANPSSSDLTLSPVRARTLVAATWLFVLGLASGAGAATPSPSASPSSDPNVVQASIDSSSAQTITGFGVSADQWARDVYRFPSAVRDHVAALLFSPQGLGLSAYRYAIGTGRGGDWFLGQAAANGVDEITAYANSAPGEYTTNGRTCGGSLRSSDVDAYASYLTKLVTRLHDGRGVTVTSVSPM